MLVKRVLCGFARSESGAVTTDWVILVGIICTFGAAIVMMVLPGVEHVSDETGASLSSATLAEIGHLGPDG